MSKVVSVNHTDTAISGVTSLELNRGLVNFGADFAAKQDTPDTVIVTNLTSPLAYPERFRFAAQEVQNIYQGTGVDPTLYSPSKKGTSIVAQLNEIWTVTDTVDSTYNVALPVQAHIVLKIPNNENITPAMVETLLGRVVSGLYETGSEATTRLQAMLRGSLKPSDI